MALSDINKNLVASEMLAAGHCNMECKYCFIPKTEMMHGMHSDIIKAIEDGTFLESLKRLFGDDLEHLSFWGTEPTLMLGTMTKYIGGYLEGLPKVENITFSSNMLSHAHVIPTFLAKVDEEMGRLSRRLKKFNLQISLDGPTYITDANRKEGATENIIKHFKEVLLKFDSMEWKNIDRIEVHFKPTVSIDNIRHLNNDIEELKAWYVFFDDLTDFFAVNIKNKRLIDLMAYNTPTLVMPGDYTVDDGRELAKFFRGIKTVEEIHTEQGILKHSQRGKVLNGYMHRLNRLIKYGYDLTRHPSMFTCSAGDTNWGSEFNGNIHFCHASFFTSNPEYVEELLKVDDPKVKMLSDTGRLKLMNEKYVGNADDPEGFKRISYIARSYHDFYTFKNNYVVAMLKELALSGQASGIYLHDNNLCMTFAYFINTALGCPIENLMHTGTLHFQVVSLIRLLANGAFEEMIKQFGEEGRKNGNI